MPYIPQENREKLNTCIEYLSDKLLDGYTVGNVNYSISYLMKSLLDGIGVNYTNINSLIGMLECVKQELYRKVASNFEDLKEEENGPVY